MRNESNTEIERRKVCAPLFLCQKSAVAQLAQHGRLRLAADQPQDTLVQRIDRLGGEQEVPLGIHLRGGGKDVILLSFFRGWGED